MNKKNIAVIILIISFLSLSAFEVISLVSLFKQSIKHGLIALGVIIWLLIVAWALSVTFHKQDN